MPLRPRSGFTLLELIIALSLGAVILQLLVLMGIVFQNTWSEQFIKIKTNGQFITISERLLKQATTVSTLNQLSLKNVPYAEDLQFTAIAANPKIIKVVLEKKLGKNTYKYQQYLKLGAY